MITDRARIRSYRDRIGDVVYLCDRHAPTSSPIGPSHDGTCETCRALTAPCDRGVPPPAEPARPRTTEQILAYQRRLDRWHGA